MIEAQIRSHTDQRRSLLAKGKTVLVSLCKRGNVNYAAEPLAFDTRREALDFQRANRGQYYSLYASLQIKRTT